MNESQIKQRLPSYLAPRFPTTYTFELTAQCNHHCTGCGNVFPHQAKHISLEQLQQIISRLPQPPASLRLTGGEITLHPEFAEIIRWIDLQGIPYVVFTNGNWREPESVLATFKRCRSLDGLLVSLHGDTPAAHQAFTGVDSFERVCANISKAVEAGLRTGTNTILLQTTASRVAQVVNLGLSLGVLSIHFSRYYGPPLPGLELSDEQLRTAVQAVNQWHLQVSTVRFNNCVPACFLETDAPMRGCTSGFTHATIDPEGNVRPCTHTPLILGNLFEQEIGEIWDSADLWAWRARIPELCLDCAQFSACRGGCRATAYANGVSQDPLIQPNAGAWKSPAPQVLELFSQARPVLNGKIYRDGAEIYLINRNEQFAIKENALPVIQDIDGNTTLADLRLRLGSGALDFIGALAVRGLVILVEK